MPENTFCVNCENLEHNGPDVWYSYFCKVSPCKINVDPVTGKEESERGQEFHFCRDINTGNCEKFSQLTRTC
jgi:hypothetical protein